MSNFHSVVSPSNWFVYNERLNVIFVIEEYAKASAIRTTVESWGIPVNWTQVDDPHQLMEYFSQSPHDDIIIIVGPEDKPGLPVPSTGEVLFFDDFVRSFHFKNTIIINMCLAGSPVLANSFIGQGASAYLWSLYGCQGNNTSNYVLHFLNSYLQEELSTVEAHLKAYRLFPFVLLHEASRHKDISFGIFDYPTI